VCIVQREDEGEEREKQRKTEFEAKEYLEPNERAII
jgi:hypothetical protein